jgi:solute:Na+ symporter, SSS family
MADTFPMPLLNLQMSPALDRYRQRGYVLPDHEKEDQAALSLSLTALDLIICCIAVTASVATGLVIAIRKGASETSSQFFLAGRRLGWPLVGASLFATNIGAEHLVGLSGDSYRYGLSAGAVELTTCICLGVACALLFPYYIRARVYTIPEFLELRYNRTARVFFSGLMLVICIMTKLAFHLYAGALVLHGLVGWSVMPMVLLMGATVAIITIVGGFTAVAYTDSIQTAIMIAGCSLVLFIGLGKVGGWHALVNKMPLAMHVAKGYADPNYPFWGVLLSAFYSGVFYWGMDQVNVQRVLGAKDIAEARSGAMFATLLKLSPIFIFALPGVIAAALYPGRDPKTTFITLLNDLLPVGVRGLVLAALICALIGSSLSVMNSISTLVVRDFLLHVSKNATDRMQVMMGRFAILVCTPLAVGAAYLIYTTPEGLYKYLQAVSIYLVMPVTPAIFFGIVSKRMTVQGAVASTVAGTLLATLFVTDQLMGARGAHLFPWLHWTLTLNYAYRGLWGSLVTIAVLFIVSYSTAAPELAKVKSITVDWQARSGAFAGLSDWRLQWSALALATVAIYAWLW